MWEILYLIDIAYKVLKKGIKKVEELLNEAKEWKEKEDRVF